MFLDVNKAIKASIPRMILFFRGLNLNGCHNNMGYNKCDRNLDTHI